VRGAGRLEVPLPQPRQSGAGHCPRLHVGLLDAARQRGRDVVQFGRGSELPALPVEVRQVVERVELHLRVLHLREQRQRFAEQLARAVVVAALELHDPEVERAESPQVGRAGAAAEHDRPLQRLPSRRPLPAARLQNPEIAVAVGLPARVPRLLVQGERAAVALGGGVQRVALDRGAEAVGRLGEEHRVADALGERHALARDALGGVALAEAAVRVRDHRQQGHALGVCPEGLRLGVERSHARPALGAGRTVAQCHRSE